MNGAFSNNGFNRVNQYGPAPTSNILPDTCANMMKDYAGRLVNSGHLSTFNANGFAQELLRYLPEICQRLSQQYRDGVPSQALENEIANYGNQLFSNMAAQSQPVRSSFSGGGGGGPTSYWNTNQPAAHNLNDGVASLSRESDRSVVTSGFIDVAPRKAVSEGLWMADSKDKTVAFDVTSDSKATELSTKIAVDRPIVDVSRKLTLTDTSGIAFNYATVVCYIREPSLKRVIDNFVKTNPKLCTGNWVNLITYSTFDLRSFRARECASIDLGILTSEDYSDLPVSHLIHEVVMSIKERDYTIVKVLEELIVKKFNSLLLRFVRLKTNFERVIKVATLDDIVELAGSRDAAFEGLMFHTDYESTILRCFTEAVNSVIDKKYTKKGFYDAEQIAIDLLAHPRFVIRGEGMFEREADNNSPDFINAIKSNYCAFSRTGTVAVCNFIPNDLFNDLSNPDVSIQISRVTNVLDTLVNSIWKGKLPENIIMIEGDKQLAVQIGVTMDGAVFITRDDDFDIRDGE